MLSIAWGMVDSEKSNNFDFWKVVSGIVRCLTKEREVGFLVTDTHCLATRIVEFLPFETDIFPDNVATLAVDWPSRSRTTNSLLRVVSNTRIDIRCVSTITRDSFPGQIRRTLKRACPFNIYLIFFIGNFNTVSFEYDSTQIRERSDPVRP